MNEIKNIVVPVDFGKNTEKLVKYAVDMAAKCSAKIHFIHVATSRQGYDMMLGITSFKDIVKQVREASEKKMENLVEDCSDYGGGCSGKVVDGDVVDGIVAYAEAEGADLIIVATHGASGLEKILLGSVAERVIKRAHCPVLSFNPYK
ncbi:MAG: universal stress protein [Desulfobulbaceae bacterium]|nr:universal stress protein [Desulfobulbaceae bacterium]